MKSEFNDHTPGVKQLRLQDPDYYKRMCEIMTRLLRLGAEDAGSLDEKEIREAQANMDAFTKKLREMHDAEIAEAEKKSATAKQLAQDTESSTAPAPEKTPAPVPT